MIRATSASQRTESSKAFLRSPLLLFENVTCLLVAFSILFIWVFPLTIFFFFFSSRDFKKSILINLCGGKEEGEKLNRNIHLIKKIGRRKKTHEQESFLKQKYSRKNRIDRQPPQKWKNQTELFVGVCLSDLDEWKLVGEIALETLKIMLKQKQDWKKFPFVST